MQRSYSQNEDNRQPAQDERLYLAPVGADAPVSRFVLQRPIMLPSPTDPFSLHSPEAKGTLYMPPVKKFFSLVISGSSDDIPREGTLVAGDGSRRRALCIGEPRT